MRIMKRRLKGIVGILTLLANATAAPADIMFNTLAHTYGEATTTITRNCDVDCSGAWGFCGAGATMLCYAEGVDACVDPMGDTCNHSGGTSCSVSVVATCRPWGDYEGRAEAHVSIGACGNSVTVSSSVEVRRWSYRGWCEGGAHTNAGLAIPCESAFLKGGSDWEVEQDFETSFEFLFSADPNSLPPSPMIHNDTLFRSVSMIDLDDANSPASIGVLGSGPGEVGTNMSYNANDEQWEGTISLSGNSMQELTVIPLQISFNDGDMDVNEDGRFNDLDVTALDALDGESGYDQWDFDTDGLIDSDDVAVMQNLVDLEWDSGLLGDADGDGDLDCDDLEDVDDNFPADILDAEYRPELDDNLDGVLDEADRHWVYHAVRLGDIDADGDVDMADLADLLGRYNACDGDALYSEFADLNRDGCINLSDQAALLGNYNTSCP